MVKQVWQWAWCWYDSGYDRVLSVCDSGFIRFLGLGLRCDAGYGDFGQGFGF